MTEQQVDPITKRFLPLVGREQRHEIISAALERFACGELLANIAKDYGISTASIYAWMLNDAPEQYREIQRAALVTRLAETYEMLERAPDPLELARAMG